MKLAVSADPERIYRTILDMEGVRHPYRDYARLNLTADRIAGLLREYGLQVEEQTFFLDGFPHPFRNIEGRIGPVDSEPAAVVMAHYDTAMTSPGANDNGSGIAALLEAARLTANRPDPPPVRFVATTLEEESNPAIWIPEYCSGQEAGLHDENLFCTSHAAARALRKVTGIAATAFSRGETYADGLRKALAEYDSEAGAAALPGAVRSHIERVIPLYESIDPVTAIGRLNRIGSTRWLAAALEQEQRIAFAVVLDEIGIFSDEPWSQGELDPRLPVFSIMTEQYGTDPELRRANFICILSDTRSTSLGSRMAAVCSRPDVDLPCGHVPLGMDFDRIVQTIPKALASDHACFWQAGIPAVFLFDTSTARDHWVHTMADSVERLDIDRLARVCTAVSRLLSERNAWPESPAAMQGGSR